jgi:RNA-binding protein
VHLGDKGLTDPVIAEIGRALDAHELIKVRAGGMERGDREAALVEICRRLDAQAVQHIGKVFVLFRPEAEDATRS